MPGDIGKAWVYSVRDTKREGTGRHLPARLRWNRQGSYLAQDRAAALDMGHRNA